MDIIIKDSKIIQLEKNYKNFTMKLKSVLKENDHYPVSAIIKHVCIADENKLSIFSEILPEKQWEETFNFIVGKCRYFSYTVLEIFIENSGCKNAKTLMKNYIEGVENLYINVRTETLEYKQYITTLEIICKRDKLLVKELNFIVKQLEKSLELPEASILMKDIIKKCAIVCEISVNVEDYLLRLNITAHTLRELADLSIESLIVDDKKELKVPSDYDNEVQKVAS